MTASPFDRLNEEGDAAAAAGVPRSDNPHPQGSDLRETWFAKWDAKALEALRLVKASGAAALYNAGLEAASLLRDMRNAPRSLTSRSTRYRDVEVALSTALTKAQAAAALVAPSDSRSASRPEGAGPLTPAEQNHATP